MLCVVPCSLRKFFATGWPGSALRRSRLGEDALLQFVEELDVFDLPFHGLLTVPVENPRHGALGPVQEESLTGSLLGVACFPTQGGGSRSAARGVLVLERLHQVLVRLAVAHGHGRQCPSYFLGRCLIGSAGQIT